MGLSEEYEDLTSSIESTISTDDMIKSQLDYIQSDKTKLYSQWESEQRALDENALKNLLRNKNALNAYCEKYHTDSEEVGSNNVFFVIPDSMFLNMMNDNEDDDASIARGYEQSLNAYRSSTLDASSLMQNR